MPEKIAFAGIGHRGPNNARQLKDRGHTITVVHAADAPSADAQGHSERA